MATITMHLGEAQGWPKVIKVDLPERQGGTGWVNQEADEQRFRRRYVEQHADLYRASLRSAWVAYLVRLEGAGVFQG